MTITGATVCYPLIGHPVSQVRTPPRVNAWFAESGIDAVMFAVSMAPARADTFLDCLRVWHNCGGCSVTVPHKQAAFRAVDHATERARRVAAVNIVRRAAAGSLCGDMTDGVAFVAALTARGITLSGTSVLLAGAGGGAGMAIALALAEAGVAHLCVLEPDAGRRARALALLNGAFPRLVVDSGAVDTETAGDGFDIAVNASPLGMTAGDPLPFDPARVRANGTVADVVTKPPMTPLLKVAAAQGLSVVTGNETADAQLPFQMQHLGLWPGRDDTIEVA